MAGTYLSFIDISYDVLLEAYVDIIVHAFFMWIGLHIGTYGWLVDEVIMLYIIVDL
jgi:hypothetical protein